MSGRAFNFVIGGSDAYGKNYGPLLAPRGRFRLAPLYDLGSWLPYPTRRRKDRLAISFDGHYRLDRIWASHWEAEAMKSGYDGEQTLTHVRAILAPPSRRGRTLLAICQQEASATSELDRLYELPVARALSLRALLGPNRRLRNRRACRELEQTI